MKFSISKKIIFIAAVGVVVSSVIILCISTLLMGRQLTRSMYEEMSAMQALVARIQHQEEERLRQSIQILAAMPQLVDAVYNKDIEAIREIAGMTLVHFELDAVTVTDARGITLARGHSDRTGDDISERPTTAAALRGEVVAGILYSGDADVPFSIRCDTPIYKDGALIGVLSLATNIATESYVDNLHQITRMHFTVFHGDIRYMTSFVDEEGNRITGTKYANANVTDRVLNNGETVIDRGETFGDPNMAAIWPITDINGYIMGMWGIAMSVADQNRETGRVLAIIIFCSLGSMLLIAFAAGMLGRKIARPICEVTDYATKVAGGSLDIPLEVHSRDEVGLLVGALNTMVAALRDRIKEGESLNTIVQRDLEEKKDMLFQNGMQLAKLQLVVKSTKIGLWDTEFLGDDPFCPENVFIWSDEFRQMLGFESEDDFPNRQGSWSSRLHPDDRERVLGVIDTHLHEQSGGAPFDVEYRMMKKDGTYAYYQTTGSTVRDENGRPVRVVGSQQDMTEIRNLINETESRRIEAEEANKAKSSFLSTMSHEIRTPMNAILGIAEIELMNDNHDLDARAAFEKIIASGDMLLGIINDILDLSKIEAGKPELLTGQYDIASLVSDTAQLNMMRIGSKPIEFELLIDENMPAQMSGDELRVKQILNNLLSNAFKYTEAGKVTLSVAAEPCGDNDGKTILVAGVSDTGQGMTKEQLDKLFDEYSRFNQEANRSTEGTGLGMSIANNLIRLMDGEIFVESEPGKGTTVTVRLPQDCVGSGALGRDVAENLRQFRTHSRTHMRRVQVSREPMPYGKVLIVDDVDTNIYVAKGLLAPYELKIDSAGSGFAAIEKIRSGNIYDIIFMDHMMPKMDGVETTRLLRDMGYNQPIVALTANAVIGQIDIFIENGFDDFISKPIDIRQMNMVLNKFIRDKQPPEVVEAARRQALEKQRPSHDYGITSGQTGTRLSGRKIAGLNISDGIEQFGGNEDSYINILSSYTASIRKLLDTINTVNEDDINSYEITVHSIKGSSYGVFANVVGKLAERLEEAAQIRDLGYINEHNPPFLKAARQLAEDLDNLLSSLRSDSPKPEREAPDKNALSKLLAACDAFDMSEVDDVMEEINSYSYKSDGGLVDWLRKNVELVNFDEIVQRLSGLV